MLLETVATCDRVGESLWRGRAENTIGWLYNELQDPETGLMWNLRSLNTATGAPAPDPEVENNARINVGDSLRSLGRLDEAEEEYRRVERTLRDPRPEDHWMLWSYSQHMLHSYGELWLKRGDHKRALDYAAECLETAEASGRRRNIVKAKRLQGQALLAAGDVDAAIARLEEACARVEDLGSPAQSWQTLAALGEAYAAAGRDDDARDAYARAIDVIETIAGGLSDEAVRDTFLASEAVTAVRAAAQRDAAAR
jgi:tetratricopeptide (TPR) repeat protein